MGSNLRRSISLKKLGSRLTVIPRKEVSFRKDKRSLLLGIAHLRLKNWQNKLEEAMELPFRD